MKISVMALAWSIMEMSCSLLEIRYMFNITSVWSDGYPTVKDLTSGGSEGKHWKDTGLVSVIPYITCWYTITLLCTKCHITRILKDTFMTVSTSKKNIVKNALLCQCIFQNNIALNTRLPFPMNHKTVMNIKLRESVPMVTLWIVFRSSVLPRIMVAISICIIIQVLTIFLIEPVPEPSCHMVAVPKLSFIKCFLFKRGVSAPFKRPWTF